MAELFYDAVEVAKGQHEIERDLANTEVQVEGSQQVEDGFILILSGTRANLDKLIARWEEEEVLVG